MGGKRLDTIDFSRPIFEIVEQHCHVEVTETLTTLHAVQGAPGIRRQLGLRPEQALLQLDEICYSRTCKPVLCCQTCYTDFFDFAMVRQADLILNGTAPFGINRVNKGDCV